MNKIICALSVFFITSCSSVLTDLASFKDPDFENREPVKVMALVVNNATMQNINRVQFALKEVIADEKIDVKFLDHYLVNPPTRHLSEAEFKKSLGSKWNADSLLFINVVSETGKIKGVDGDLVDAEEGLKEKGRSDRYTTIAYGKYTASLMDIKTWRTIWKADLIAIDEKFKNTTSMYELASEKIIMDLLDKGLLTTIKDKKNNNITSYDLAMSDQKSDNIVYDVDNKNNTGLIKNSEQIMSYEYLPAENITQNRVVSTKIDTIAVVENEKKQNAGTIVNGINEKNVKVRPIESKKTIQEVPVKNENNINNPSSVNSVINNVVPEKQIDVKPVVEQIATEKVVPVVAPIVVSEEAEVPENNTDLIDEDLTENEEEQEDIFADAS